MQLVTRPQFYLDVVEEVEYLATKAGEETARRWQQALDHTIQAIRRQPGIGRPRPDLQPEGIRSWRLERFRRWLIFYTVREKSVVLLRVRYGAMDLPALEFQS
jgi:plasmid stabilization system protein ParE